MKRTFCVTLLLLTGFAGLLNGQEQQTARIGDFKLESGEVIRECTIGYRTFGTLNPGKSNAVLFPTSFGWRSAGLATRIGPGKLVDSGKYYAIAIDSHENDRRNKLLRSTYNWFQCKELLNEFLERERREPNGLAQRQVRFLPRFASLTAHTAWPRLVRRQTKSVESESLFKISSENPC